MNFLEWQRGLKDGLPVALAYLAVSFSFGIIASQGGLSSIEAAIMSFTNLTSAGQFAGLSLIAAGAAMVEIGMTQLIINARYILMSFAFSQKIDPNTSIFKRMVLAAGITDEVFALSMRGKGKLNPFYTYGVMCLAIPGWTIGTYLGVVSGDLLHPRLVSALSIALYGMLLAVIIPPGRRDFKILGIIFVSMVASFLFEIMPFLQSISSGSKILILTIILAGLAAVLFPVKEDEHG